MKYSKMPLGRIEALINKLGGETGVEKFLTGQTEVVSVTGNEYDLVLEAVHTGTELLGMGNYDKGSESTRKEFGLDALKVSPKRLKAKLINLGQDFSNEDDAHALLIIPGFRHAGIEELLMFGALAKPRETDILVEAVKAFTNKQQYWATHYINFGRDGKKSLGSPSFRDGYGERCRFLMVRNS